MNEWGDWARAAFDQGPNPSFADLLRRISPSLLPQPPVTAGPGGVPGSPHGTTVLALRYAGGIVVAGDRRATEGHAIADRRIEKVFPADSHSAVAIAGVAATAVEIVKLLQLELEHYEKLEGESLSLEGKANRLAGLIKQNFPFAMQGLIVVPLFAGYDVRRDAGRIFRYDAIGGRYEELDYHATGSGGVHARGTLRKRWRPELTAEESVRAAVEALVDASEEDTATGGPDLLREIYPLVAIVDAGGYRRIPDEEIRPVAEELLGELRRRSV